MTMAMAAGIGRSGFWGGAVARRISPSTSSGISGSRSVVCVRASTPKLKGVELPKENPKLPEAFWGFTSTAELWNARAGMLGIVGITLLELICILQTFGIDVGKGLDLPL